MQQQLRNGLLVGLGFAVGLIGTFFCMGAGWIVVALLLLALKRFESGGLFYLKVGLTSGLVVGIGSIMAMGAVGMISN